MRDDPFVGSIEITTSIAIFGQAHPATNQGLPLFQGHFIRFIGQLSAIQQGSLHEPWQQRYL